MKPFVIWKMPFLLGSLGAALLFSPDCKAQAEIAPDHFDGTDSWELASHIPVHNNPQSHRKLAAARSLARPAVLTVSAYSSASIEANPAGPYAVVIADKRKTAANKSKKQ